MLPFHHRIDTPHRSFDDAQESQALRQRTQARARPPDRIDKPWPTGSGLTSAATAACSRRCVAICGVCMDRCRGTIVARGEMETSRRRRGGNCLGMRDARTSLYGQFDRFWCPHSVNDDPPCVVHIHTPNPQILKEGSGASPPKGDEVVAHYTGTLEVMYQLNCMCIDLQGTAGRRWAFRDGVVSWSRRTSIMTSLHTPNPRHRTSNTRPQTPTPNA